MEKSEKIYQPEDSLYYVVHDRVNYKEIYEPCHKLIGVIEGTLEMTTAGKQLSARKGEYLFVTQGNFSKIKLIPATGKRGRCRMICFNITGKEIENYLQRYIQPIHPTHTPVTLQKLPSHILLEELFTSVKLSVWNKITCWIAG